VVNPSSPRRFATYRLFGKRCLDIVLSLIGLLVLGPVMAVVAVLVRLRLGSPVLFRQLRPGRDAKPFKIMKFRSMFPPRPGTEHLDTDSERTPKLGIWLRKLSLDEFPQLFNVLRGDMSLVGPRPLRMEYVARYSPRQRRRLEALPGVTGLAQVKGRNSLTWDEKFELDVHYVDHMSLWLDVRIIFLTVWRLVRPQGIAAEGHTSMPNFLGSGEAAPVPNPEAARSTEG
jgi:sugar transferase EpsL